MAESAMAVKSTAYTLGPILWIIYKLLHSKYLSWHSREDRKVPALTSERQSHPHQIHDSEIRCGGVINTRWHQELRLKQITYLENEQCSVYSLKSIFIHKRGPEEPGQAIHSASNPPHQGQEAIVWYFLRSEILECIYEEESIEHGSIEHDIKMPEAACFKRLADCWNLSLSIHAWRVVYFIVISFI